MGAKRDIRMSLHDEGIFVTDFCRIATREWNQRFRLTTKSGAMLDGEEGRPFSDQITGSEGERNGEWTLGWHEWFLLQFFGIG